MLSKTSPTKPLLRLLTSLPCGVSTFSLAVNAVSTQPLGR